MRSIYSIKLELLLGSRIRVEQVNLFELKFNLSITLLMRAFIKRLKKLDVYANNYLILLI